MAYFPQVKARLTTWLMAVLFVALPGLGSANLHPPASAAKIEYTWAANCLRSVSASLESGNPDPAKHRRHRRSLRQSDASIRAAGFDIYRFQRPPPPSSFRNS